MPRRPRSSPTAARRCVELVAVVLAMGGLAACAGDEGDTALAISSARQEGPDLLVLRTDECAERIRIQVERDLGGSELPQVTLWGHPTFGRCRPAVEVPLTAKGTAAGIIDGATGTVLPVAPPR